ASNTAGTFQLPGKRVDVVEIAGESGLVVGKKKALRQRLGNQQQPLQAPRLDDQRALLQPFGPRRINANVELVGLHALVGILSSRRKSLTQSTLRIGRGAKEYRNAVAKQHRHARIEFDRHGRAMNRFGLRPGAQIKSLPQQEGADSQSRLTRKKDLRCFHALTSLTA